MGMGESHWKRWIPAFAGMTKKQRGHVKPLDSRLRGNDGGVRE
jgi:hypothetical protein